MQMPATLVPNAATAASSVRKSPCASWNDIFDYLDTRIARVSREDIPMPHAANLEKLPLPSVAEMLDAAIAVCTR